LTNGWPMVDQWLTNGWPMLDQWLTNGWPLVGRFWESRLELGTVWREVIRPIQLDYSHLNRLFR
jgi:hypothetical protein